MDSAIQRLNNTDLDEATSLLFIRLFPGLSLLLRGNYWELKPSRQRQDQQCQKKLFEATFTGHRTNFRQTVKNSCVEVLRSYGTR